ncbi:hypothetical protein [Mesoflavibacter zeaxanthinifaciens]|uniref:hypothetical protein n=1 Tax=Mesoflavibacter zeaxanthinifaciens TaxID=393060 RepID=UPI003A901017
MKIKFTKNTDTSKFDKEVLLEKIDDHDILKNLDLTIELERIFPTGVSNLVVFQTKNTNPIIAMMLNDYFLNHGGIFRVYSQ